MGGIRMGIRTTLQTRKTTTTGTLMTLTAIAWGIMGTVTDTVTDMAQQARKTTTTGTLMTLTAIAWEIMGTVTVTVTVTALVHDQHPNPLYGTLYDGSFELCYIRAVYKK